VEEEVVLLEEQLAAAHTEIERLQARLADTETAAAEAGTLRRELAELKTRATQQAADLESLRAALAEAEAGARAAAARYREAVLGREPQLPADLVSGDTVDAVDESLARARETVAQVRQHLEQEAHALRVPAGAPVRAAPDFSGLSAAEKIRLGLQQQ
jgi:hypothetical protein